MASVSTRVRTAPAPSRRAVLTVCCGLAMAFGLSGSVSAQAPITWTGASGGTWTGNGNWSSGAAPANDQTSNVAVFTASTSGSVNVNAARSVAGLDIQRDVIFYGSTLTLGTTSALTLAANTTATFNNTLARGAATGTFSLGNASTLTFNNLSPGAAVYNLTNATINFNGNVSHSFNPDFYGTGTLNYGFSGTASNFRFNIRDSANLVIKATSGGDGGVSSATYLRYYGPGTLTLERDFTMLNAPSGGISVQNGALSVQSSSAAIVTVAGGYTGRFNQLVFLSTANGTFRLDGSTLAIGDGTAGKVQGVFVGTTVGATVSVTSRVYTLDATANGGTVRVTGSSTFNNFVTGTAAINYGAQLALTGPVALFNNGNWQNQNLTTTAVLTGIDVGASATLAGTGTFNMAAVNGANAKNTLVSGTVAPGDPTISGGIGTLTMNTGTMSFGAASTLRLDVGSGANNNDLLVINGIAAVTAGAAVSFNASGLDQGKYTLATASSGLSGFTSSSTPAAYRLAQSGTEIALFARAVQSVGSLSIGGLSRVMQNQSLAFTGTVTNSNPSGGDALVVSLAQLAGSNLTLSGIAAPGSVAASGGQQVSGTVATGSTLGARTWGLTNTDNAATVSTASGSATVNVLDNRTVTAGSVSFGVVRQTASGSASVSLTSNQSDSQYTRITVGNGSGGGFSVTGDAAFVFSGTGNSNRTLSGSFATAGVVSGTIALANASAETGGTLQGQTPGTTNVTYTASVFDGDGSWNLPTGGAWGSGASANWTSTGGVGAAPGTFGAGFTATDTARFGAAVGSGTATVTLDGAAVSLKELVFNNSSARYVLASGTGNGSLALAAATGKPIVNVTGIHEIAARVSGSNGLEKTGLGTLVLSGSNDYSGGTDVSSGRLLVNGFVAGNVNVAGGALLGGSGSIDGTVSVSGTIAPGNSPGLLTVGSLLLSSTATTMMEIDGLLRGSQYDAFTITSTNGLTYGGDLLLAFGIGSALGDQTTLDLFSFTGTASGSFTSLTSTGFYAGTWEKNNDGTYRLQQGSQTLTFSLATGDIVVVPEPRAIALAGLGAVIAAWHARRRHRGRPSRAA